MAACTKHCSCLALSCWKTIAHQYMQNVPKWRAYQSLIRTLMYAMLRTCLDIAFVVSALSKYSLNPGQLHWAQAVHILRYLVGTKDYGLAYDSNSEVDLSSLILGSTNTNGAGDIDTWWSTSGYIFQMCSAPISWSSKLQVTPALLLTES